MLAILACSFLVGVCLLSSPISKEHCSMVFSIGARCIAHSFSIRFGKLSGPDAFDGFIFANSFSRPF